MRFCPKSLTKYVASGSCASGRLLWPWSWQTQISGEFTQVLASSRVMYSPRTEKFINWPLYLMKCILNQFWIPFLKKKIFVSSRIFSSVGGQQDLIVRPYVRPSVNNSDLQNLDSLDFFFCRVRPIVRRLRSFLLKRFEFYANFAKLKRRLRSFRLKRFEVYANFARLSTLMSVKFVAAKHSSQTLRGVR